MDEEVIASFPSASSKMEELQERMRIKVFFFCPPSLNRPNFPIWTQNNHLLATFTRGYKGLVVFLYLFIISVD
jgi:hypothetical protein